MTDLKLCVCVSHCLVCEIVSVFVCVCFQLCQFVIEAHWGMGWWFHNRLALEKQHVFMSFVPCLPFWSMFDMHVFLQGGVRGGWEGGQQVPHDWEALFWWPLAEMLWLRIWFLHSSQSQHSWAYIRIPQLIPWRKWVVCSFVIIYLFIYLSQFCIVNLLWDSSYIKKTWLTCH